MSQSDSAPIPGPSTSRARGQRHGGESSTGDSASRPPSFVVGSYRGLGAIPVKGQSFCSCPVVVQERSRYLKCNCGEDDVCPEWIWDPETASGASELSDDGQTVRFHVKFSCGTAAVRGAKPLNSGQYFWEIKMITPVYGTDMMVGVGTSMVELDSYKAQFCSLLGRDAESWGLSYMGRLHHRGQVLQYGSRFGQGSIIGIHVDMWHGTLTFYKNRRPMGICCSGLKGKVLYPMVCSTAAQSGMKLIKARSFHTSLQFMCCQALRRRIPHHLDVFDVLPFPPGLKDFLANNLSWLLQRSDLQASTGVTKEHKEEEEEKSWSDGAEEEEEDDKSDTSSETTWTPAASPPSNSEPPSWVGAFDGSQLWTNKSTRLAAETSQESTTTTEPQHTELESSDSDEASQSVKGVSETDALGHSAVPAEVQPEDREISGVSAELSSTNPVQKSTADCNPPSESQTCSADLQAEPGCSTADNRDSSHDDMPAGMDKNDDGEDSVGSDDIEPDHKRRRIMKEDL